MNSIGEWSIIQVSKWLNQIKLSNDIIENFQQHNIDGEALVEMNKRNGKSSYDKLLKELGFKSIGSILKFQKILANQIGSDNSSGGGGGGGNNTIDYNEQLWWKIWRSKVLKDQILTYYRLLSLNYNIKFNYKEELLNYINRDYITVLQYEGVEALPKDYIPNNVKKLIFKGALQDIIPGSIPPSVKEVVIERNITSGLKEYSIPLSVEVLRFGNEFNQQIPVNAIPHSIRTLQFGLKFNQQILPQSLPSSITSLSFGDTFNQHLPVGIIPSSVLELSLGLGFNGNLVVPPSVTKLSSSQVPISRLISVPNCIPDSIKEFTLLGGSGGGVLPLGCIPFSTQKLVFSSSFNQTLAPGCIPLTVSSIKFINYNIQLPVGSIPSSCTSLDMGILFNKPILPKSIPLSVRSLNLGPSFNQSLKNALPPSIIDLNLEGYNFPLAHGDIPFGVVNLVFGNTFNQALSSNVLPPSVKSVQVGKGFNQFIGQDSIHSTTKIIKL